MCKQIIIRCKKPLRTAGKSTIRSSIKRKRGFVVLEVASLLLTKRLSITNQCHPTTVDLTEALLKVTDLSGQNCWLISKERIKRLKTKLRML